MAKIWCPVPWSTSILVMVTTAVFGLATFVCYPKARSSREVGMAAVMAQTPLPQNKAAYNAETFCSDWVGQPTKAVDCRNSYALDTLQPVASDQAGAAWMKALAFSEEEVARYTLLAQRLETAPSDADQTMGLRLALQQKIDSWRERLDPLSEVSPRQVSHVEYNRLFLLLLDLGGSSYDPVNDRFHRINWHVARLMETPPAILVKAQHLQAVLQWLPWSMTAMALTLMLLGWWRARCAGLLLMVGFSALSWLSLLMIADASVHFGEGSAVFLLNPLSNQLTRQHQVLWMGTLTILAAATSTTKWGALMAWPLRHLWIVMPLLLLAVAAAYVLQGPAMGAEILKVSMAFMAGLVTSAHGRSVHLASQLAPQALSVRRILRLRSATAGAVHEAQDLIASHLGKPVFQLVLFCTAGLAMAALAFHDLGAALVTAIVAACALFLVFGGFLTAWVMGLMTLVAAGLSQTSKVQERIALMLDPMGASVSDFARLVAFSNAGRDHGFALGHMPWCNPSGVCIPLQALSDYMPVVMGGLFGFKFTVVYFCVFLLILVMMGRSMMHSYLTRQGHARTWAIVAFYLLVCTGAQTVITFLGNWRIIPLTGIGAPLLSIGLSSALVPCMAVGLFLALHGNPQPTTLSGQVNA